MKTCKLLREQVAAATGSKKAELVLKNAQIVNVFTQSVETGDIAIEGGYIVGIGNYEGITEKDLGGAYVCPGFLDGHIHIESSMTSPGEFERAVVPHGTIAVITDPHEIANVAGTAGIRFMMQSAQKLDLDVYFMLPSCVPATDLDESGAELLARDLEPFYADEKVLGLAEMMNAFGVTHGDKGCFEKLVQARSLKKAIDGHAPALSGKELNAYVTAGIRSDHECSDFEEAKEKFARGQWIMIRQGTAAKNLKGLIGMFEDPYYQRCLLVTDDKHPGDLIRIGHIDAIIREAVSMGADDVYLATDRAFGGADTLATSYTLAAAIRKLGSFDLIFCGQESLDSNTAQIGPEVAATLSMPDVSGAVDISYEREGYITVRRQLSDEDEVLEMKLPALITTAESLNRPRYPSVLGIMKKDHVEIHKLTSADLDVDPSRIGLTGSPTRVKQVRPVVPPKKENLRIEGKTTDEAVDLLCTAMQKIHVI